MTIIDRPRSARDSTATTRRTGALPATLPGGSYVSTTSPRPVAEGSYVSAAAGPTGQARAAHRGTYVTTARPSVQRGGTYTYSG